MRFQDNDALRRSLRHWLLGREYHRALKAMEIGLTLHTGQRKDGSPEFIHQLSQVQYARTLESSLLYPEDTFVVLFLHDAPEDHDLPIDEIDSEFGPRCADAVELFTDRTKDGFDKPLDMYFSAMQYDPITSIGKGIDRIHNFQTMIGVFTPEKQLRYLAEGEDHILPMMRKARKRFTKQEQAFHNVMHVMRMQMELIYTIRNGETIIPGTAAAKSLAEHKPD